MTSYEQLAWIRKFSTWVRDTMRYVVEVNNKGNLIWSQLVGTCECKRVCII